MGTEPQFPFEMMEVAAALIHRGDRILAVFNPTWKEFALPMTRRRKWQDPNVARGFEEEAWIDAAARAAAEWLEQTCSPRPQPVIELDGYQQSDRDGVWRRYNFKAFDIDLDPGEDLPPGKIAQWLTVDEFLDENRRPISKTTRKLLSRYAAR